MSDHDEPGRTLPSAMRVSPPTPARTPGQVPTVPDGRFSLPEGVVDPELGRGGMGRVLRLTDPSLDREVAVKELLPVHRGDALLERLFHREAQVLARLEHPGVVPVYEVGRREDGTLYYAMRRIRGDSLHQVLKACASLSDRLALLGHCLDVVQTVGYAHSKRVVHRDLKAENVMVSGFGETLVIDWGLAVVDGEAPDGGISAGTPTAMAPEQAAGTGVDARSDVFSLGVLLYEVLGGALPFTGATASEVMASVQRQEPLPLREREPQAPPAVVAVVERALRKDPAQRYPDAGAMADALEAALAERARPSRWPGAAAAALLLVAAGLGGWVASLRGALGDTEVRGARALAQATRAREDALGAQALAALRGQDALGAAAASQGLATALGRGVALLAAEAGVPGRVWTVRTEAGCAAVAVSGAAVACATLNQVLLLGLADGASLGALETGPRGWQQGVVPLSGGRVAAAGDDRTVRTFEVATRRLLESRVLDDSVSALAADGAGGVVVGLQGGQVLGPGGAVLQRHRRAVTSLVAAPGLLASASALETLVTRNGEPAALDRRAGALGLRGGELLLGVERAVAALDAQGHSRSLGVHRAEVTAVTALEDGRIVSGDAAGQLRWWSPDDALLGVAQVAPQAVQALAAAGPGQVLVASGRTLEAWALPSSPAPAWEDRPTAALVSPVRRQVLAGFADGRVRRVPAAELEVRHQGAVRALAEVPGEERPQALRLLSAGDDGRVLAQRWSGEVETLAEAPGARMVALAVAPDGARAAWASSAGEVTLYSLAFGRDILRLRGSPARSLAFAPGGRRLAVGRADQRLQVLDAETGDEVLLSDAFDAEVTAVAWLNPAAVVVARADGALSEYLVDGRQVARRWTGATRRVTALAADEAHQRVAAGGLDGQVWVWGLEGAGPVAQLPADASEVSGVGFLGDALLFVGGDRLVHEVPLP